MNHIKHRARRLAVAVLAALLALSAVAPAVGNDPVVVIDSPHDFKVQFDHDRQTVWLTLTYDAKVYIALFAWTDSRNRWGWWGTPYWQNCDSAGGFSYSVPQVAVCFIRLDFKAYSPVGLRVTEPISKFEIWD